MFMNSLVNNIADAAKDAAERTKQKEYQNATAFLLRNGTKHLPLLTSIKVQLAIDGQSDIFPAVVRPEKTSSAVPKIAGGVCGKKLRKGGKRMPKKIPCKCTCTEGTPNPLNGTVTCNFCAFVSYTTLDKILKSGCGPMKMPGHNRK